MYIGQNGSKSNEVIGFSAGYAIEQQAIALGVEPTDANKCRVVKAIDLWMLGSVSLIADFGIESIYFVSSCADSGIRYIVLQGDSLKCSCADYRDTGELCEHGMTIKIAQSESARDVALCADHDAHAMDGYC